MKVGKLCSRRVDDARTVESVQDAAQRMLQRNVGSLVVVDDDRRPEGIVTDRDLALRSLGERIDVDALLVGDVMTPEPVTIPEDAHVDGAVTLMKEASVRRLPVVDGDGRLYGVLTLDDVLEHLARQFQAIRGLLESEDPSTVIETVAELDPAEKD